jgi:mannose-6-phosphate isomerase-like protein (cupin superfamily)
MSKFPKDDKIKWLNVWDSVTSVCGFALVKRGFKAYLHQHIPAETYYFLYGTGKLQINDKIMTVSAPAKIHIPSNALHAMTPITSHVLLMYYFPKGPFSSIQYIFTNSRL